MGRMLDALQRVNNVQAELGEQPSLKPLTLAATDADPLLVGDEEEVPFIEVGPRKSMEASPSVLACTPVSLAHTALSQAAAIPREEPVAVPTPPRVHFRALPDRPVRHSRFAPELVAYHAPDQPAARPYREVLAAVLKAAAADDRTAALLFTPALPRSGSTTTLLNIAVTAARQDCRRIVVVDANLRQPAIADRLGLPSAPGLREALAGAAALDDVLQPTEQTNLFALTAGLRDAAGVRFVSDTMRSLLRQLRQRFALVFVDGPRWDGRPEATALASACDAVFLIAPEQEAETPQTDALLRLIPEQGARLAGCILVSGQSPFI